MAKYEYKIVKHYRDNLSTTEYNYLSSKGWEYVSSVINSWDGMIYATFKREINK